MEWIKIPYRAAWRLVMVDEGLELSGYIAFAAFLSLFPFLIFLATLAGFLGDRETANEFIQTMFHFMPKDVAETLAPAVREVVGVRERSLLTLSILTTLWFASSGVEALRSGLNRAYKVGEQRAIWWLRLQSIAVVIVSAVITFFLSLAVIFGPLVWRLFGSDIDELLETRLVFITMRYVVAVVLLVGALLLLHRSLPNTTQPFRHVLPGVCVTAVLWLGGASLFSWYVGNLANYALFYGSLGGVAITLVFFYLTAIIFIFGAEFNAVWRERVDRRRAREKAAAEPQS